MLELNLVFLHLLTIEVNNPENLHIRMAVPSFLDNKTNETKNWLGEILCTSPGEGWRYVKDVQHSIKILSVVIKMGLGVLASWEVSWRAHTQL